MLSRVLLLTNLLEFFIVTWCVIAPLWSFLPQLGTLSDWWRSYQPALSNFDVWLAVVVRGAVNHVLVASAPERSPCRYGDRPPAPHGRLRLVVSLLSTAFELLLMVKAAVVAVVAPEQLWPDAATASEPGAGTTSPFVGLVYMYVSVVAALLGSLIQASLAHSLISQAKKKYEAPPEPGSLEAPLLGGEQGEGEQRTSKAGEAAPEPVASDSRAKAVSSRATSKGKEGDDKSQQVSSKTVWALLRLSAPDWHILLIAFAFGSLAALAQATIPYYTGMVIDYASIEPDAAKFRRVILKLLVVSALCGVCTGIRGCFFTLAMGTLNMRIRRQLFQALLNMEVGFFDVTKTGDLSSRLAADTTTVSDQICLNLNVMLRSLTQAAMVLAFMFSASWRLTVVTFIVVPAVMTLSKFYGKYFAGLAKRVRTEIANANSVAEEVLSSMTTVKSHAAQDSALAAYMTQLNKYFVLLVKEAIAYCGYMAANTFLPNSVAALVLFYGGHLVLDHQMSPGALVSFMLYQQSLNSAFQMLGDVFSALTTAVGSADKVLELMHRRPEFEERGSLVPAEFSGRIELKDVHFHYPARPHHQVLRGLSLEVPTGQVVALVGPSGGGKSSIVKLVERFYLPQQGVVLLDGRDVGSYNSKWLRRQVALVSQEPVLYARSIRRNIIYGLEPEDGVTPPSQEEIEEAAKQANAHGFVTSFPDGYDTDCGEKGVTLSGGQKQRLAIARALVRRPRILLLDEATSALDTESEAMVQEALDRVMAGRTVLVIAHRLSTVQGADRIIVIGNGVVQEVGSHEELLMSSTGVYASLVRRQLAKSPSLASMSQATATHPTSAGGAPPQDTTVVGAMPGALALATTPPRSPSPPPADPPPPAATGTGQGTGAAGSGGPSTEEPQASGRRGLSFTRSFNQAYLAGSSADESSRETSGGGAAEEGPSRAEMSFSGFGVASEGEEEQGEAQGEQVEPASEGAAPGKPWLERLSPPRSAGSVHTKAMGLPPKPT